MAATGCEHKVAVTDEHFIQLRARLKFDRRKDGSHGRALIADYGPLGLFKGDRLEPSPHLPCLAWFDTKPRPFDVMFWRPSAETAVRHRSPLFSAITGIAPEILMPDWLHGLSLG
eukprot:6407115-Pyramimonas_sp.AAC.1